MFELESLRVPLVNVQLENNPIQKKRFKPAEFRGNIKIYNGKTPNSSKWQISDFLGIKKVKYSHFQLA